MVVGEGEDDQHQGERTEELDAKGLGRCHVLVNRRDAQRVVEFLRSQRLAEERNNDADYSCTQKNSRRLP